MQRVAPFILCLCFLASGCGDPAATTTVTALQSPQTASSQPTVVPICDRTGPTLTQRPLPADLETVFDPIVIKGMESMDAVGLTFAIQCAESPLYVRGYGLADLAAGVAATADTVYEIGSVSKQFVAAQVMSLARDDRLSLDDPIGTYLPWLPDSWLSITLLQLLSHTGGIPDHFAMFNENPDTPFDWTTEHTAAQLVEAFVALDDQLIGVPGTTFSYSNTGYAVLTAVIEHLSGQGFATVMDEEIFQPLGLERSAFCSPGLPGLAVGYNIGPEGPILGPEVPASFLSGAAGICSSAPDLIRWERQLVEGVMIEPTVFQDMSSPRTLDDGTTVPYGLGLHLEKLGQHEAIFHEGGTASFSSWLAYYPDSDLIVAILTNTLGPNMVAIRDVVIDLTNLAVGQ